MAKRDPWADAPAEMTAAEYLERLKGEKQHKYGAEPCVVDGVRFASKAEARRYGELQLLVRAGVITELQLQPRYALPAGIVYQADFSYAEAGKEVIEEVKGFETQAWRLKKRLMAEFYPNVELRIVRGR